MFMLASDEPSALITMFAPLPGGGATARSLFSLARLLRRRMQVDVVAPRRRGQRYTESNGQGRVYRVPLGGVDYGAEAEGRYLRAVQRQVRGQAYDVVVVGDPLSALAVRHSGVTGLHIVYALRELRSAEINDYGSRLQQALASADRILVPSSAALRELSESGLDPANIDVMPPYLELRSLIASEPVPVRKRMVLLGADRPERLASAAAQLLDTLPPDWTLVVLSDGGQSREELKMLGEGYDALRLELPLAWPTRRLVTQLGKGGIAVCLGRDEASQAFDLPSGDSLLARASGLYCLTLTEERKAADLVVQAEHMIDREPLDVLSTDNWPSLADLLAQWLGAMGVSKSMVATMDSQEPTGADSGLASGTATRTDWVETDLSRVDLSSASHELSAASEVVGD